MSRLLLLSNLCLVFNHFQCMRTHTHTHTQTFADRHSSISWPHQCIGTIESLWWWFDIYSQTRANIKSNKNGWQTKFGTHNTTCCTSVGNISIIVIYFLFVFIMFILSSTNDDYACPPLIVKTKINALFHSWNHIRQLSCKSVVYESINQLIETKSIDRSLINVYVFADWFRVINRNKQIRYNYTYEDEWSIWTRVRVNQLIHIKQLD